MALSQFKAIKTVNKRLTINIIGNTIVDQILVFVLMPGSNHLPVVASLFSLSLSNPKCISPAFQWFGDLNFQGLFLYNVINLKHIKNFKHYIYIYKFYKIIIYIYKYLQKYNNLVIFVWWLNPM